LNEIRREEPALTQGTAPCFIDVDNDELVAYARSVGDSGDVIIVVVNLDPYHLQSGWLELPLDEFGLQEGRTFQAHDLLGGGRYLWHGRRCFVSLDPASAPAHVLRLRRRVATERDFDYYL
jgi:starch synthase (maltosyl-transferring)